MNLLDTDHISLITRNGTEGQNIVRRIAKLAQPDKIAVSIVSCEEQMRGWLAESLAVRVSRF